MIKDDKLNILVEKHLRGTLTLSESESLDLWKRRNPNDFEHRLAIAMAQREHFDENDLSSAKSSVKSEVIYRLQRRNVFLKRLLGSGAGVSSILIIAVLVSQFLFSPELSHREERFTVSTDKGQISSCILPDSSKVWLNGSSTIKYWTAADNTRRLKLIGGEVYFDIAKDVERPFIVMSNSFDIKVYGTQFNIKTDNNGGAKVSLVEGSIGIFKADKKLTEMRAGEQVEMSATGTVLAKTNIDSSFFSAWKEERFEYDNISLEEIADYMSTLYNVKFKFSDERIKLEQFRFVIDRNRSLLETLEIIKRTSNVTYKLTETKILLKRK